ncbi:MAG: 30S ribosomal protein S5 [Chloroflexota bacterium]|nr:30S ribosomal protein S5 [Chloroflexota bacterium]
MVSTSEGLFEEQLEERTGRINASTLALNEKVVHTRRVAKVVKGGRHLRFNALVVVGDGQGVVGIGLGKADAIPDAVRKGTATARKSLIRVVLKGRTIPHDIIGEFGAARVLLKPAPQGTGIIAAGTVRTIMDLVGAYDVVTKSLGSRNPINVAKATLSALEHLVDPATAMALRKGVKPKTAPAMDSPEKARGR